MRNARVLLSTRCRLHTRGLHNTPVLRGALCGTDIPSPVLTPYDNHEVHGGNGEDAETVRLTPVGALTSKPYAFTARPWELKSTDSIDVMNAMGSHVKLQSRGTELMRVVPRTNDEINEEWIDDKTRFSYDGLKYQRLTRPMLRSTDNPNQWDAERGTWRDALASVAAATAKGSLTMRAVIGPNVDLFSAVALADWALNLADAKLEVLGSSARAQSVDLQNQFRFNSSIANIDEADLCLLVGTNLPVDAPLLIARMRKGFLADTLKIASLGFYNEMQFPVENIGLTADKLVELAEGKHPFCKTLAQAEKPMLLVDSSVLERSDGRTLCSAIDCIAQNTNVRRVVDGELVWDGVNILHRHANDVGILELGRYAPFEADAEAVDVLFLMGVGAEDLPVSVEELKASGKFIIYQGHHGDELASAADVILPGYAYSEKAGVYVNMEGRAQQGRMAVSGPGDSREDWKIIRALSEVCKGDTLPYADEDSIRARCESLVPSTRALGYAAKTPLRPEGVDQLTQVMGRGYVHATPFQPVNHDFHLQGNAVSRASKTMAQCSQSFMEEAKNFI